jgi:hypothetical protein
MEIKLPNNAIFDTELQFENQTQECQAYFFEVMNASEPATVLDDYQRPLKQTWNVDAIGFEVSRITEYSHDSDSWNFDKQYHVTVRKEWHEDKIYQIIMSDSQYTVISKENIDFVYAEAKKRESYLENGYIYQYTDILLDEHRIYLESKGITINTK